MPNFTVPEQLADANKATLEALQALAKTAFARSERLATLNLNTARAVLEDGLANSNVLLAAKDPQELAKLQADLAQPMIDKALAYAKNAYEIASEGQEEISKLMETRLADMTKALNAALDQAAKSAPSGSEAAFSAVKSALAAASDAYDSMSKAAKQATETAEANMSAATEAALKALNVKLG